MRWVLLETSGQAMTTAIEWPLMSNGPGDRYFNRPKNWDGYIVGIIGMAICGAVLAMLFLPCALIALLDLIENRFKSPVCHNCANREELFALIYSTKYGVHTCKRCKRNFQVTFRSQPVYTDTNEEIPVPHLPSSVSRSADD